MPRKKTKRQPFISLILAANGTGKSYLALQQAKKQDRALIISKNGIMANYQDYKVIKEPKELRDFTGIANYYTQEHSKEWLLNIRKYFRNGLLIFDDAKAYIKPNIDVTLGLADLLTDFRHISSDVIFVFHSPNQVPPAIYDHSKYVIVGYTKRLISNSRKELMKFEEIKEVQQKVNAAYKKAKQSNKKLYGIFKTIEI